MRVLAFLLLVCNVISAYFGLVVLIYKDVALTNSLGMVIMCATIPNAIAITYHLLRKKK